MFITSNAFQIEEKFPSEISNLTSEILLNDPQPAIQTHTISKTQRENLCVDCDQENGFFKGVLIVLPVSIALWVVIGWGIHALFLK